MRVCLHALYSPNIVPGVQWGQYDGDGGLSVPAVVDLRPIDHHGRWGFGMNAVSQATQVALRTGDFKIIAGVRQQIGDHGLPQASVHLHLLTVVLHLRNHLDDLYIILFSFFYYRSNAVIALMQHKAVAAL